MNDHLQDAAWLERFWAKVDKTDTCWLWIGFVHPTGYGYIRHRRGKSYRAHRVAYEDQVGPIPEGLVLDHLCRVRHCVNPAHLEPVTLAENVRRGTQGEWAKSKTECPSGHPYDEENTTRDSNGHRRCRKCLREIHRRANKKRWARIKAERASA